MILGSTASHQMSVGTSGPPPPSISTPLVVTGNTVSSSLLPSMTSSDGITWDPNSNPSFRLPSARWTSCCYAEDYNIVALASTGSIRSYRSYNNGYEWFSGTTPINNTYNWTFSHYCKYGTIIAIDPAAGVASITYDLGDNWSSVYSIPVKTLFYQFGLIVGVNGRFAYTSTNGITWNGPYTITTDVNFNNAVNEPSITWANGTFITAGTTTSGPFPIYYSSNGVTWNNAIGVGTSFSGIASDDYRVVAITSGSPGQAVYSNDSINWTGPVVTNSLAARSIAAGAGKFLIVSEFQTDIKYSVDFGASWLSQPIPVAATQSMISISNGRFGI